MELREKIFELLEIRPDEEFSIISPFLEKGESFRRYKLTNALVVRYVDDFGNWHQDWTILPKLLTGEAVIKKIIVPNKAEQLAIDYARACGCKWIAKESDGRIYAFSLKPIRTHREWLASMTDQNTIELHVPISFIRWEDEDPYYIGDEN